jgi:hypothetical protein
LVKGLLGIPVVKVSAGGYHSLALSLSGSIIGWGKNRLELKIKAFYNRLFLIKYIQNGIVFYLVFFHILFDLFHSFGQLGLEHRTGIL